MPVKVENCIAPLGKVSAVGACNPPGIAPYAMPCLGASGSSAGTPGATSASCANALSGSNSTERNETSPHRRITESIGGRLGQFPVQCQAITARGNYISVTQPTHQIAQARPLSV